MKLIYPIIILFLLISAGAAQLSPDKERFDVVLHPGELTERTLKVKNIGDAPILKITSTQMSGSAKDFIFLAVPEDKSLKPKEQAEIDILFAVPPESKPGLYSGYIYLLESNPPAMPIRIEFNLNIVGRESYGLGMTIDDALSASKSVKAEDIAEFDLNIKNLGQFRDMASIDVSALPRGWKVTLLEGDKELFLPGDVALDPGATHSMKLLIQTSEPGRKGDLTITATSLGNRSRNTSVVAGVKFGMAIRGYNVDILVPDIMVANKTYKGSFNIMLDVTEKVMVGLVTPPNLMVIPLAQVVEVAPEKPGVANFTMLASEPGDYPIIFKLMDSNGIPMPEEMASVKVVFPQGLAVLTGEDFLHSTVASLTTPENRTVDVITTPLGKLEDNTRERLQDYASIVIFGNQSVVAKDAEKALEGIPIKRIEGENLCIESWLFASEMWQNGTSEVILSGPQSRDIFRAYQVAKMSGKPLVICEGSVNEIAKSAIKDLTKRNITLSKAFVVGDIGDENARALQDAGVLMEEVT